MEVTNCKDIDGNIITDIQLNDDGTVWAVLEIDGVQSTSKLSHDCCTANDYTFDPTDAKCYWSDTCSTTDSYKIILDPEGTDGVLFQVDENQQGDCILEVELDFLLKFDCANVTDSLKNILESLSLELSLEKVVYDESLPIPDNLETVQKMHMVYAPDLAVYLEANTNTGLTLVEPGCTALIQNLITDLGENSSAVNETSFLSEWVRIKMTVDDPTILSSIYNERLKVAILTNDLSNFSILIDNINLRRVCDSVVGEVFLKDDCPSFEIKRVIDNKKSWTYGDETENRDFDLSKRLTNYNINHEKLSINTKEVDLLIKPSVAIENNVFNFIKENPCLLSAATGCTDSTSGTTSCIDINALLTVPITELVDSAGLMSQLIDVKSRKVISSYPTIELVYNRYLNSYEHCGAVSDSLSSESVDAFIDLIGGFWSDLIEQVVPATTIWGSSHQFSNSTFTSGFSKYKYRKSTTLLATSLNFEAPSPTSGINNTVDIVTEDLTDISYFGPPEFAPPTVTQTAQGVSVIQIEDSSEFIGTVTVIGGEGEGELTGNTITITETISDGCDTYNKASSCD
jgi:hypothetical protein